MIGVFQLLTLQTIQTQTDDTTTTKQ